MGRSINEFLTWYQLNTNPTDEEILTISEELADDAVFEYESFRKSSTFHEYDDLGESGIPYDVPLTDIINLR